MCDTLPARDSVPVPKVKDEPDPAVVNNVPDVGKVTELFAVAVNVCVNAPECVTLPAKDKEPVPKVNEEPDPVVVSNVPEVGNVTVVVPVAVRVVEKAPLVANVEPSAKVNVALVAGAVSATLLTLVAVATPIVGVTNVGEVANTKDPVPVSSVTAEIKFALVGVARNVATPVPKPDTPVLIGNPVAFVNVTLVGVPNIGVTKVGDVENTKLVDVVPVAPDAV